MDRLGPLDLKQLDPDQKEFYTYVEDFCTRAFGNKFVWKQEDGSLIGPISHTDHAIVLWSIDNATSLMADEMVKIEELPAASREVAILVVGAHEQAAYEFYAHSASSRFARKDLEDIWAGNCPNDFDDGQKVAFQVASRLCEPGPLPLDLWNLATRTFGQRGATALVHYIGYYKYTSTILNGFDAKVPDATS